MRTFDELLNSQNLLSRKEMAGIGGGYRYKYRVECNDGTGVGGEIDIADDLDWDEESKIWRGLVDANCNGGGRGIAC